MEKHINRKIREIEKIAWKKKIYAVFASIIIGIILGVIAKLVDNPNINPIFDNLGGRLGIWIFTAVLLAAYSSSPNMAAIRVFFFFMSMLSVYYIYTIFLLKFFPERQMFFWGLCALISPICAFVMWFARGRGLFADFCVAMPIAVIFSEAYISCKSNLLLQGIYLCLIVLLLIFLPINKKRYLYIVLISVVMSLLLIKLNVLSFLFGGWNTML